MKALLALAVCAAFASGLIGTWAFSQLTEQAGAAPPPPAPTQVREQNLDGSGFIRVHEQGTANVAGTVNVGNLPAVQDVNVVSQLTTPAGRLIELGTQTVGGANEPVQFVSDLVDVSDCDLMTIMAKAIQGAIGAISYKTSPDGTTEIEVSETGLDTADGRTATKYDVRVVMPFVQVLIDLQVTQPDQVTAWIWCEP